MFSLYIQVFILPIRVSKYENLTSGFKFFRFQ